MAKAALVIGASRGIGREFVRQLRAGGWKVFATARSADAIAALEGEGAHALNVDVTRPESLAGLAWQLDGEAIDLALYVAGVLPTWEGAGEPPAADAFDATMHANVLGAMQVLPLLAQNVGAARGKFVFLSSMLGSVTDADSSLAWVYRASKAALNIAVHSARGDYPELTLAVISPGWVKTDMGGPDAPLSVQDSVAGMLTAIDRLKPADSGSFLSYDGREMNW